MSIEKITHQGKLVTYVDYRQCKSQDDILNLLENFDKHLQAETNHQSLLLADFDGVFIGAEYMKRVKPMNDMMEQKYVKRAVLGITGGKKILLSGFNLVAKHKVVPFDTKEEAIAYLVS